MKSEFADYQRVVEVLRDLRSSNLLILTDEVRRHATDYAALCRSANDRLRQCSTMLQKGFRTEAIQLAEEQPKLLDLVAALDLPEPEIWAEFCQQHELPVPPPLQLDRASQLNDAYDQEEPLKMLLAKHRRLALARSPVKQRLDVMRQIYTLDPSASFWEGDLRQFEQARFAELFHEFSAAKSRHDRPAMQAVAEELSQTQWVAEPPEPLRNSVEHAARQIQQGAAIAELHKLVQPLREAFMARNLERCRELLQQCRDILSINAQAQFPNDIVAEIQPVADWIKREDKLLSQRAEVEQATQRLRDALEQDLPNAELTEAIEALRMRGTVPQELEAQYNAILADRARKLRRSRQARFAIVGALLLVFSVLGVLIVRQMQMSSATTDWARRMRAAVDAKNVDLARQLVEDQERLVPSLSSSAAISAVKNDIALLDGRFNADAQTLKKVVEAIRGNADGAAAKVDSATVTPDELVAAAGAIEEGLAQAKRATDLAWVDRDRQVAAQVARLERLKDSVAQKIGVTIKAKVEELSQQVVTMVPGNSPAEFDASVSRINDAIGRAKALLRITGIDDSTRAAAEDFIKIADQRLGEVQQVRDQLAAIKTLQEKPNSADAIKGMLDDFVAKFPKSPLAADFTRASESAKLGKALEAWRDLAATFGGKVNSGGAAAAQKRVDAITAYLKTYPDSPLGSQINALLEYAKQEASALSEKGPWQSGFNEMLSNPLMSEVQYIDASNGKRYWILGALKKKDRRVGERGDLEIETIDPRNLTKSLVVKLPAPYRLMTEKPVLAPHATVARDLAAQIKLIDENNWSTWGIEQAETLARNKEIDPVVKALLVQQMLKTTRIVAGWGVGDLYDKASRDLARHDLENTVWYDPEHPVPDATKASIQKVMESIPASSNARALLKAKEAEFAALLGFTFHATGVLMRDSSGAWHVYLQDRCPGGATAWAVRPMQSDASVAMFYQVARFKDGQLTVDEAVVRDVPQGTIVFIRNP